MHSEHGCLQRRNAEHKDSPAERGDPPKGEQLLLTALAFNSIKVQPQLKNGFGRPPAPESWLRLSGTTFSALEKRV